MMYRIGRIRNNATYNINIGQNNIDCSRSYFYKYQKNARESNITNSETASSNVFQSSSSTDISINEPVRESQNEVIHVGKLVHSNEE